MGIKFESMGNHQSKENTSLQNDSEVISTEKSEQELYIERQRAILLQIASDNVEPEKKKEKESKTSFFEGLGKKWDNLTEDLKEKMTPQICKDYEKRQKKDKSNTSVLMFLIKRKLESDGANVPWL